MLSSPLIRRHSPSSLNLPHLPAALFSAWVESRPDLISAIQAIRQNPAAALAPLPTARVPALYQARGWGRLRAGGGGGEGRGASSC